MKDITPPNNRRSIRNVIPPRYEEKDNESVKEGGNGEPGKVRDFKIRTKKTTQSRHGESIDVKTSNSKVYSPGEKRNGWLWWFGVPTFILGVILILGFGISSQFATAEVIIEPLSENVENVQEKITFHQNPSSDELGFEIITVALKQPRQISVPASGEDYVEEKASGVITVYNEFSTSQQILVTNTRFENPNGLIYRINESLTIPGMSDGEPGVARATVYADEPGEEYNIAPTTFTIPGFKGSAQFDKFYAKSDSSMHGGRIGNIPVINDEDMEGAEENLRKGLEEELLSEAESLIPEGFILFGGNHSIEESREMSVDNGSATLILNAFLHGVLLKEDTLAQHLYKKLLGASHPVEVKSWENLNFVLEDKNDLKEREELDFSVSGEIQFFRTVDKKSLAIELAGVSRRDTSKINNILDEDNYPIFKAEVSVSPFWMPSIPGNPEKINIKTRY